MGAITRSSILGFFLGILPGGGAVISSFVAYAIEKRISKHPEKFGTGVAALEQIQCPVSYRSGEDFEKVMMKSEAAVLPLIKAAGM